MQNTCDNTWWNYGSCPMKYKDHDNVCCCYYRYCFWGRAESGDVCGGGGGGGRDR